MLVCLWDVEGCDKCESGIFGQVSEDMGQRACFRQFDSVDGIHDVGLKAARSVGIRDKETDPCLIVPGRVTDYRCQVGNPREDVENAQLHCRLEIAGCGGKGGAG